MLHRQRSHPSLVVGTLSLCHEKKRILVGVFNAYGMEDYPTWVLCRDRSIPLAKGSRKASLRGKWLTLDIATTHHTVEAETCVDFFFWQAINRQYYSNIATQN